jgi:molybdopterin synthase sulfur carrier subunit
VIEVLLFASLRERVGAARLEFAPAIQPATVASVIAELRALNEAWDEALGGDNILCAVNQQQVNVDHPLVSGDEVAFFPPVTGG